MGALAIGQRRPRGQIWTLVGIVTAIIGAFYLSSQSSPDFPHYIVSATFLGFATLFVLLGNHDVVDPSLVVLIYFALHYSVMIPLYGLRLAWSHFAAFLENNWILLCDGNFGALLGICGYGMGILVASLLPTEKVEKTEFCPRERAGRYTLWYGLIGVLGWLLIVCADDSPLNAIFGRPTERRSIFGYFQILLFCSIISFVLYQVHSRGKQFLRLPNVLFLLAVLWMNMVKGARLDLMIILLTAFILNRLLRGSPVRAKLPRKFESLAAKVKFIGASLLIGLSLYVFTLYRSDIDAGSVDFPNFLHSLADSAGYLVALDRFPRQFDFWGGMAYLHPFVIYIPSALFPSKYSYTYGITEFTELLFGYSVYDDASTTSHTYSILGEGYINFGWFGLVLTMLIFGYFNRRLYLRSQDRNFTMYGAILYALYYSTCVPYAVKSGLVSGAEFYTQNCLVMFALPVYILSRRGLAKKRKQGAVAANIPLEPAPPQRVQHR